MSHLSAKHCERNFIDAIVLEYHETQSVHRARIVICKWPGSCNFLAKNSLMALGLKILHSGKVESQIEFYQDRKQLLAI